MQDLVGIVRTRGRDAAGARRRSASCSERAARVGVGGNREYNPGWHTALDLHNLLTVSEAITRSAIERKESRGGHFRDDYPDKDRRVRQRSTSSSSRRPDGAMQVSPEPIPPMPAELKQVIEEMK